MALVDELGYRIVQANGVQRAVQGLGSSAAGEWILRRTLHGLDRRVFSLSNGRMTASSFLAGVPILMLTTRGAKSGRRRTSPLIGFPISDSLAVIGSNYGQQATPGWVYNLEAEPAAKVSYRNVAVDVVARRANEDEVEAVFAAAAPVYPGYAKYRKRAAHRTIRVFVLDAAP